ncbi:pseudouridine synthase [Crassisporium funariophilum]|nr:pseudouridine synthase [Crassisporium funariophilum]
MSKRIVAQLLQKSDSPWLRSRVLYADRRALVLNKPPGLVCQLHDKPEPKVILDTCHRRLKIRTFAMSDAYPVHRLDKGTTGCLLIALNRQTAKSLCRQFEEGTVHKSYLALVRGGAKSFPDTHGQINEPVLYEDGRASIYGGLGKASKSEWKLIASSPDSPLSLLRLNLITGNKHQLRIHLAECLKAPILGDALYSKKRLSPAITALTDVPSDRIFLHASEISFFKHDSVTGERFRVRVRAPLPPDFRKICEDAGIALGGEEAERALYIRDELVESTDELIQKHNMNAFWATSSRRSVLRESIPTSKGDIDARLE